MVAPTLIISLESPTCNPIAGPYNKRTTPTHDSITSYRKRRIHRGFAARTQQGSTSPEQLAQESYVQGRNTSRKVVPSDYSLEERGGPGVVDALVLGRIVDSLYPLINAYYTGSANSQLDTLTQVQSAEIIAFQSVSSNTFGNVSMDALALRLAYTLEGNYASEGPPDPREDVQDMICEASTSAADTWAMIVAVQSACTLQKCNIAAKGCKSKHGKRALPEGTPDFTEFYNLKRYFDQVCFNECLGLHLR